MASPTNFVPAPGGSSPGAGTLWPSQLVNLGNLAPAGAAGTTSPYVNRDGFDLVWSQQELQVQMTNIETNIDNIENNANLSDTEKMFSMQMAMNTWSAVANLRTNELKSIADVLQNVDRNVAS